MSRKRSSQRLDSEDRRLSQLSIENHDTDDLDSNLSDGDDVSKFNERVKSFDATFSKSAKAAKIDPVGFSGTGGTIKEIELFNFMCHEHLKVELKENINFIVGNNGSGKSAILTALTVCLGARASSTQRATSLESLIKEGASEARVTVKISNTGALCFKGESYGDSIIVERRFKRNGPNSFKIKAGKTGFIVSERKDEVVAICDNYNIQVDNPLSVLTQETAKKFLVNSTPQDLYEFFMRATQLEQLSVDYAYSLDRMKSIQNSLTAAKKSWPALAERIEALKIDLDTMAEQKEMSQKIIELRAEIEWANIQSLETAAKVKEKQIQSDQQSFNENNDMAAGLTQKLTETSEAIKSADSEVTALFNSKRPLTEQLSSTEKELAKTNSSLREYEEVLHEINTNVIKVKQELAVVEGKIDESTKDTDSDRIEKQNEIQRLEQEIQEKSQDHSQLEQELTVKKQEYEDLDAELDKASRLLAEQKRIGDELAKDLDKAQIAAKNKLKLFGDNLPEVMEMIKKRSREFKYAPIGPIGMHVELIETEWSNVMDAIIGSHMKNFITRDHKDRVLLESILKSCNCNNAVINLSNTPIDISNGEPDRRFLTALRALRINNEMVKKALIMFASIERTLLIADRVEARETMLSRYRNVEMTYTHTHRITATQNSLAFFAIYSNAQGNFFESGEERVISISNKIKDNVRQINIFSRDSKEIKSALDQNLDIQEDIKNRQKTIKQSIYRLKNEIRALEEALDSTDETGVDVLKSERDDLMNKLELLKSQCSENFDAQIAINSEIESLKAELVNIREEIKNVDNQIEEKKKLISTLSEDKRKIQIHIDSIQLKNRELAKLISIFINELKSMNEEIEIKIQKAEKVCERIQTKRSVLSIEKEIIGLEKMIEKGIDFTPEIYEQVKNEYEEKAAEYEKSVINVRINENILDDMKIALEKRQRQWENLRSGIAKRSNQDFSACLQSRDYHGCLEYDHNNRALNINVHIDHIEQDNGDDESMELSKRDIKQLSGGEKSFGTTCFLLSLWDAMGCPIRCLDEFDVYMDAVNRRLVVEMLINNAKNSGTQFILITPVSVRSFLDSGDEENVHMVVLNDPQRSS